MNLKTLHKVAIFIFGLFLIFSSIVILVGEYFENTLLAIILFILGIYIVYFMALKTFIDE